MDDDPIRSPSHREETILAAACMILVVLMGVLLLSPFDKAGMTALAIVIGFVCVLVSALLLRLILHKRKAIRARTTSPKES